MYFLLLNEQRITIRNFVNKAAGRDKCKGVRNYLLFIDTEASALPIDWSLGYGVKGNWPYCVQVAWIVYTAGGDEVKRVNRYINNNDFKTSKSAFKVHGISDEFRHTRGIDRTTALTQLINDLNTYKPLIIGHFIELDFNILAADYHRQGIENPLKHYPTFCTMRATKHLVQNPQSKFLRLSQLYSLLLNKKLSDQHNAIEDAKATADCFFELVRRGELKEEKIALQQKILGEPSRSKRTGCFFPLLLILLLTFLIYVT